MSRTKKTNPFAYCDGLEKNAPFAMLTDKQALSPTYQKLSDGAKHVLMICRLCRKYHKGTDKNGSSRSIHGNNLYFYFNRAIQKQYGLTNPNRVRAELIELVSKGFLDVIECNAHRRKKNVYAFCAKWQELDHSGEITLSDGARTYIQGKGKG